MHSCLPVTVCWNIFTELWFNIYIHCTFFPILELLFPILWQFCTIFAFSLFLDYNFQFFSIFFSISPCSAKRLKVTRALPDLKLIHTHKRRCEALCSVGGGAFVYLGNCFWVPHEMANVVIKTSVHWMSISLFKKGSILQQNVVRRGVRCRIWRQIYQYHNAVWWWNLWI